MHGKSRGDAAGGGDSALQTAKPRRFDNRREPDLEGFGDRDWAGQKVGVKST